MAALDADSKTFVVHVAIREWEEIPVYSKKSALVGVLLFDKASIEIPAEYSNNSNVFSAENLVELPKNTGINEHAIILEERNQPPFGSIISLGPVKLDILKTYIETNLANGFIRPSMSLTKVSIFFDQKPDRNLRLCVDYWDLNNITIKYRYPLSLIGKSLDWLSWAKRFTQLDLTNAYYWMRIREGDEWKTVFQTWYSHFKY